jgi:putative ABC transport system permease protein
MLYVHDELSYDKYNINAGKVYRINNEIKFGDIYADVAQTPALLGVEAVKQFAEVQQYTRLRKYGDFLVRKGNTNLRENLVVYADSTLFEVFSLPMISGDSKTALTDPHSLVITETIAKKYFNRTNVAGQYLIINDTGNYKITGVIKDIPQNSHFNFDFFLPFIESKRSRSDDWLSQNFNTYVLLKKEVSVDKLEQRLTAMLNRFVEPELKSVIGIDMHEFAKQGSFVKCSLTPLTSIHLRSNKIGELGANGSIQYVYIFSLIAFFILIIACANFMNLFVARSSNRAREVGVRKVLGSQKKQLVLQFLTESLLISFIALIIALLITWLMLSYFNQLSGKNISVSVLFQPFMIAFLLLTTIIVGLLAGSYPAFLLSAFQPIEVLKGKMAKGFKGTWLRNAVVIFQFSISIILIVATIVIYSQINYMGNKDIGFNRQQVLVIQNTNALRTQATMFKNELLQLSGVVNVTMTGYLPVKGNRNNNTFFTSTAFDPKDAISMQSWYVDENYIPTLGIKIIEGRNFSLQSATDSTGMILNEAAAKFIRAGELLNKKLYELSDIKTKKITEYHIIGVVKNFHFNSLREAITPLALFLGKEKSSIAMRLHAPYISNVLLQVKNKWQQFAPGQPFTYSFMDEEFNDLYSAEQRTARIVISFALLAIFIACLGLFALVAYAAEQRIREIGIRKVLGASILNIVHMLSVDFLKLVSIAMLISFPIAWWAMHKWLQDFTYRIKISGWVLISSGGVVLLIALLTVSLQAIKAAIANPVKSLRTE